MAVTEVRVGTHAKHERIDAVARTFRVRFIRPTISQIDLCNNKNNNGLDYIKVITAAQLIRSNFLSSLFQINCFLLQKKASDPLFFWNMF